MLVDQNIRRLVGAHWHVVRKFGMARATIHEWGSTHEITQRNLLQAVRRQYAYSKEHFAYYKSAELHTHKAKIPKRVFFLALSPLILIALAWYGWHRATAIAKPKAADVAVVAQPSSAPGQSSGGVIKTKAQYLADVSPRLEGLYYTAPRYDEVTKPVDAPFPAACLISKGFDRETGKNFDKCGCIDQQGNRYAAGPALCREIAMNGVFKDWGIQKKEGPTDRIAGDAQQPGKSEQRPPNGSGLPQPFTG